MRIFLNSNIRDYDDGNVKTCDLLRFKNKISHSSVSFTEGATDKADSVLIWSRFSWFSRFSGLFSRSGSGLVISDVEISVSEILSSVASSVISSGWSSVSWAPGAI